MNVKSVWTCVWHPEGSAHLMQMKELLEVNRLRCMRGDIGYAIIGVAPSMETARELKREFMREKREETA